ncbi:serine hydrolase [Mucilaginibacter lappiensis]|uniref:serine hydrolase n=1 Tax=Mucilaginibacter lappiensis TaxID=354630 RepID=UPI003D1BC286
MKTLSLSLTFTFLLFIQLTACAQSDKDKIQQVEKGLIGTVQINGETPWTIQERMAYFKIPGLSVAVIQNYHIVWAKGYGFANDSLKTPVTAQTLFQAGSISKSLNAVGVLKLVQDKKLDLYTDINNYLTSWKFPYDSLSKGKKITMANLLSHTAGLNMPGFPGYQQGKSLPTIVQILDGQKPANTPAIRSKYAPGIRSEYSGGGIIISQLIVMDVTHQAYADYMKKAVLDPLGMKSSTFIQPPTDIKPDLLATGYGLNNKPIPGKYRIFSELAAAGLWTNPTDLAKYIVETQLAYEGRSAKILNQATTKLRLTPYLDKRTALGIYIDDMEGAKYFEHAGATLGFRSWYYGSMEGGNGVVVMINSDHDEIIKEVVNSVAKVYGFKGLYHSTKTIAVADTVLQAYTGVYQVTPQFSLTVSKEDKQLYVQPPGRVKSAIFPKTPTSFVLKEAQVELEFVKDATGKVYAVMLKEGGQNTEAKKIK